MLKSSPVSRHAPEGLCDYTPWKRRGCPMPANLLNKALAETQSARPASPAFTTNLATQKTSNSLQAALPPSQGPRSMKSAREQWRAAGSAGSLRGWQDGRLLHLLQEETETQQAGSRANREGAHPHSVLLLPSLSQHPHRLDETGSGPATHPIEVEEALSQLTDAHSSC